MTPKERREMRDWVVYKVIHSFDELTATDEEIWLAMKIAKEYIDVAIQECEKRLDN